MKYLLPTALIIIIVLQIYTLVENGRVADQRGEQIDSTWFVLEQIEQLKASRVKNDCTIVRIEKYYTNEKIYIDSLPNDSLVPYIRTRLQDFDSNGIPKIGKNYGE